MHSELKANVEIRWVIIVLILLNCKRREIKEQVSVLRWFFEDIHDDMSTTIRSSSLVQKHA